MMEEDFEIDSFCHVGGILRFKTDDVCSINSPATFARVVSQVLGGTDLRYKHVEAYVDDVLVHTPKWGLHIEVLDSLFTGLSVECG